MNLVKLERLKIVLNDPIEEEKQHRIQLEQLKYLSRTMYNSQMQLGKLKQQIVAKPTTSPSREPTPSASSGSSKLITPVGRLCHTMRLVNKSIHSFADIYPYRADNNPRSDRLCFHFYKQVHSCVENFNRCILGVLVFSNLIGEFEPTQS